MAMSILNCFTVMSSKSLPNPRGPLSNRIASAVIESANRELHVALNPESASSKRKERSRVFICHISELNWVSLQ